VATHFSKKTNRQKLESMSPLDDFSPNKKTGTWESNFGKALGTTPRAFSMYSISALGICFVWGQKWWPTNLRIKILLSQLGDASCTIDAKDIFL
jgi:hypothetical protein